jgi:hypothetical protein
MARPRFENDVRATFNSGSGTFIERRTYDNVFRAGESYATTGRGFSRWLLRAAASGRPDFDSINFASYYGLSR